MFDFCKNIREKLKEKKASEKITCEEILNFVLISIDSAITIVHVIKERFIIHQALAKLYMVIKLYIIM
jgi:hypothetical protein